MIEPTIGIGRYLIKEKLNEGLICMQFVSSNKQLAYVFTEGVNICDKVYNNEDNEDNG